MTTSAQMPKAIDSARLYDLKGNPVAIGNAKPGMQIFRALRGHLVPGTIKSVKPLIVSYGSHQAPTPAKPADPATPVVPATPAAPNVPAKHVSKMGFGSRARGR